MRYRRARGGSESGSISRQLPLEPRLRQRTGRSWASFPDRAPASSGWHRHPAPGASEQSSLTPPPRSGLGRSASSAALAPKRESPGGRASGARKDLSLPASPDSSTSMTRCWSIRSLCANYDSPRHCCQSTLRRRRPGLPADAEPKEGDGSRPCALARFQVAPAEARGREKASAVAEQYRQDVHQDLVHEPPPQALTGHVSTEDFEGLAARRAQRGGEGFPDITTEERDPRVRRVRWFVGEDELSSSVVGRGCLTPIGGHALTD